MNEINSLDDIRKEFLFNNGGVSIINDKGKEVGIEIIYSKDMGTILLSDTLYSSYFKDIITCNTICDKSNYSSIRDLWDKDIQYEILDFLESYNIELSEDIPNKLSFIKC